MSTTTPTPTPTPTPEQRAVPLPHELTAEWTVRAQLTFARAGEPVQREYSTQDPLQPVRVVYKWSTPCDETEDPLEELSNASTCKQSGSGAGSRVSEHKAGTSFRSTNSSATNADYGYGVDSAFGSPRTSQQQRSRNAPAGNTPKSAATAQMFGTRCRSTCNIIVSAVADFLPQRETTADEEQFEPFVYHTSVQPEQNFMPMSKALALRDAFSQTSDTETKFFAERRHPYEQRRATTEGLMSFANKRHAEEANTYAPTYSPTPTTPSSTFKSASLPRIPPLPGQQLPAGYMPNKQTSLGDNLQQKKPRTVHIDVYCTGSEDDEEQADGEASSSDLDDNDTGSKRYDMESNSTRQTVLDNEQMLLRHQRINSGAMPRRLGNTARGMQQQQLSHSKSSDLNLGHAITKSSTAEEVSESKQLLFRKHIGDQRAAKLANLRQKYMRQPSDDTLSSVYPNSSRSTVPRDATCSSISSAAPSNHAADFADSSWKETDEPEDSANYVLAKSDSFDYENSLDRLRIRQMERQWSRQHSTEQFATLPAQPPQLPHLQTISEVQSQRSSPYSGSFQRSDTIPSESDAFSDNNNVFHTYPGRAVHSAAMSQYQRHMQARSQAQSQTNAPPYLPQPPHFQRNRPGFLQFFGPQNHAQASAAAVQNLAEPPMTAPVQNTAADPFRLYPSYQPHLLRWKSEGRDNLNAPTSPSSERSSPQQISTATIVPNNMRCGSEAPPTTTSAATFCNPSPSPIVARRFEISRESPSVASEASTTVSGYTQEHLEKARRFGKVVAARKPGHHVGPTKNPNCLCESCQRWLAERFQIRGRAFSLGERPVLRRPQL